MIGWTVGIDPGATGAIAVLDQHGTLCEIHDMPYDGGTVIAPLLAGIINNLIDPAYSSGSEISVWVEQVGAMPKQGIASTWKFAQGYGTILGVCGALGVRTLHVTPAVWKRVLKVTKDKGTSRLLASELWPHQAAYFARVKDDGRAEAALIARYGLLQQRQGLA